MVDVLDNGTQLTATLTDGVRTIHAGAGGKKQEATEVTEVGDFLLVFVFIFIVVAQVALFQWKKYRYSSFRNVTLVGLWTIPLFLSLFAGFIRMVIVWTLFSFSTAYIIKMAREKPLQPQTPRYVYAWFYRIYQVCSNAAIIGYGLVVIDYLFITSNNPTKHLVGQWGLLLAFYGFYYGVLGRDCSEMCADWMASVMGFTGKKDEIPQKHISQNICGICGGRQSKDVADLTEGALVDGVEDKTVILNCQHHFHSWCIRGWTIVGKKDMCPICCEKVDLSKFINPWEKQSLLWGNILDAVRYLIVWNPIILFTLNFILSYAGVGETP